MNQPGESAEQIVNMATNVTIKGVSCVSYLAGRGALFRATFPVAALKDEKRISGKTRMRSFRGKPTRVFGIYRSELKTLAAEAKKYCILYAAMLDKRNKDGLCDICLSFPSIGRLDKEGLGLEEENVIGRCLDLVYQDHLMINRVLDNWRRGKRTHRTGQRHDLQFGVLGHDQSNSTGRGEAHGAIPHSESQHEYITNAQAGSGLLRSVGTLVPFTNQIMKDIELYWLITTEPGESVITAE